MRSPYIIGVLGLAAMVSLPQRRQQQPHQGSETPSAPATPSVANPHYAITDEDRNRKNPVDFTELTVERAGSYSSLSVPCAMARSRWQRRSGSGNATHSAGFHQSRDAEGRTDGELFKIISLGNPVMPAQDKRMKDLHVWELVNFLRAAGGAVPAKSTGKELSDEHYAEVPQN